MRRLITAIAAIAIFFGINLAGAANAASTIGLNLSSAEYAFSTFPTSSNLDYIQSQNITLVRLPIAWERIQPTLNAALETTYLAGLKSFLDAAAARDIKVIVDLHNYGRWNPVYDPSGGLPPGFYSHGPGDQSTSYVLGTSQLPLSVFADLWKRLATALAGHPALD